MRDAPGHRRFAARLLGVALLLAAARAGAGGLGVSPILLEFDARSPAQALWLRNAGAQPLRGQLRAFAWTQESGEDHLTPTRELVLSPPMLELEAGQQQLVRVIRTGAYPDHEQAYRILVNELPASAENGHQGLNFVMEFSVPVFVGGRGAPALDWSLRADGGARLGVRNSGSTRAQLSELTLLDAAGGTLLQQPGLLGYALAGQARQWPLSLTPQALAAVRTLEVRLNGERVRADLRAHDSAP
ncbi:fimbrial biogenesis chaperone [Solimonas flava]|uniref:fimbrial biogenesis chaperone n=1 Tax=Solimonas flava TaxID=415849 RepID=UPI000421ED10|nr:fimbria/pilus periplasmic chaperone [Solimonas flava]